MAGLKSSKFTYIRFLKAPENKTLNKNLLLILYKCTYEVISYIFYYDLIELTVLDSPTLPVYFTNLPNTVNSDND